MIPAIEAISSKLASVLAEDVTQEPTRAIGHTRELDRILAIPRRVWREDDPAVMRLVFEMSEWLRRPGSRATLRPIQAFALAELHYLRGLFCPMRVGSGKTLVTFLAPTVLGSQRPVLCVPPKLREKTRREFERLAEHWRAPASLRILSFRELSLDYGTLFVVTPEGLPLHGKPSKALIEIAATNPRQPISAYYAVDGCWWPQTGGVHGTFVLVREFGILDMADPDLVMSDEAHHLKNPKAACTRKMSRFMDTHPMLPYIPLSGTITKDKIQDFAHVASWALKTYAPVPRGYHAIKEWGNALNVKVSDEDRIGVGALIELADPSDLQTCDALTAARRGFRKRLIETPGVVAYAKQYDGASLLIEETPEPKYAECTEADFKKLRENNNRADDSTLPDGLQIWAYARQRSRGFYYTFDPKPPEPWKNARTEWYAAVRQGIKYGHSTKIDSEKQVALACVQHPDWEAPVWQEARRAYAAWQAIKPTFRPRQIAVWCDDAAIRFVADWMADHKGLVWVDHVEFAERLSKVTGAPFFHEKGFDASGRFIEEARPDKDGSIIVSIESNNEGINLQHNWFENLFTSLPKGGNKFEQTLGRTHRDEQPEDEVTAEVMITCREDGESWFKILEECRYMTDATMHVEDGQPLPAKVFYADCVMPSEDEIRNRALQSFRYG